MKAHSERMLQGQGFQPTANGWISADGYWVAEITDKPTDEVDADGNAAPLGFVIAYRKAA